MLEKRIELESDVEREVRYEKELRGMQRAFELFYDLGETIPVKSISKFFGGLADVALSELRNSSYENLRRKRFFRILGQIRVPLTSI